MSICILAIEDFQLNCFILISTFSYLYFQNQWSHLPLKKISSLDAISTQLANIQKFYDDTSDFVGGGGGGFEMS